MNFSGNRIVLTGATGGIGSAVAERLASEGASLTLIDRQIESLEKLCELLSSNHEGNFDFVACDFLDNSSVKDAISSITHKGETVVGLVNIAGVAIDAPLHMVSEKNLEETLMINLTVPILFTQQVSRVMIRQKTAGSIVNISSITGIDGNPGQLAYGASKAALINATLTMALELGENQIRVNAIAPGVIETEMTLGLPEVILQKLSSKPFLGRLGKPEEIASVVSWLLSEKASYVTGQTLRVDGCV